MMMIDDDEVLNYNRTIQADIRLIEEYKEMALTDENNFKKLQCMI